MQVEIISTGDEVITGFITDTNVTWLCQELLALGIQPRYRHTVSDRLEDIVDLLKRRSQECDLILVNGGLGPTSDDNTTEAAALACGVSQVLNEQWLSRIEKWHKERNRIMPETNKKQAMLPSGCTLIDNKRGTACGYMLQINKALCIFTPGVPSEFVQMYSDDILPYIKEHYAKHENTEVKRFFLFGISESRLGSLIEQHEIPDTTIIGYRAEYPLLEVKIISHNATLEQKITTLNIVKQIVKPYLIVKDSFSLDEDIASLTEGYNLNIFDTCTKGHIAKALSATCNNMQKAVILNPLKADGTIKKLTRKNFDEEISTLKRANTINLCVLLLGADKSSLEFAVIVIDENGSEHILHARQTITLSHRKVQTISLIARTFLYKILRHKDMIKPDGMEILDLNIFE